ncbi:MAG: hypothetical protein ND807_06470 [Vicinamibacterales bacterium]|nr:hypothetical protein [Vicinamibacterales bacterium]
MHIKIQGGTVQNGQSSLCHTCRRATVVKGASLSHEIVECSAVESRVTFAVASCTSYVNRQHPSLYDMEDIAWILRTDAKRSRVGFVGSKDLKFRERHVLSED